MERPRPLMLYQKDFENIQELLNDTAEGLECIAANLKELANYFTPDDEDMEENNESTIPQGSYPKD